MTKQWTKQQRIQRMNKRIQQLDNYIDDYINQPTDTDRTLQPPINALKAESDLLRRIAEEQGDIPRATPEQPKTEPIDININGINPNNI